LRIALARPDRERVFEGGDGRFPVLLPVPVEAFGTGEAIVRARGGPIIRAAIARDVKCSSSDLISVSF